MLIRNQRTLFENAVLPDLASSASKLDALAADADMIVASSFVLAAPIVCEKRKLPLVSVVLQPMAFVSAFDPPRTKDFWMMASAPVGRVAASWNRCVYAVYRQALHSLYGRTMDMVRANHGLPPFGARHIFEASRSAVLTLGCYSPHFAPLPLDAPGNAALTGFPIFDGECGSGNDLDPALDAFLAAGSPPIVFTLGTFATRVAGEFYNRAAEVSRRLGMRAVLLTGREPSARSDRAIFECAYAPHSRVFPGAAAIVHHGGIGTTGQALRAGRPQLVIPHMGDQNDHAQRITQLGVGMAVLPSHFSVKHATNVLSELINNRTFEDKSSRIGVSIASENGAQLAAKLITDALESKNYSGRQFLL